MILEKKKRFIILTLKREPLGSQEKNFKINLTNKTISFHGLESQGGEWYLALWEPLICVKKNLKCPFYVTKFSLYE